MAGKKYSKEFKTQAIELANDVGVMEASRKLGVDPTSIRNWSKGTSATESMKKSYEELEKEVKGLKKELGYVNTVNDVLKKSTAVLSKDIMDSLK